jgi:acyl-CoA reductase-like NAD-dependent aldehyde dehydrogenase
MTVQTPIKKPDWHARAKKLKPETRLFIDGKFVEAKKGGTFPTVNPATGEVLAQMSKGGAEDVDLAVKAARRAFHSGVWSKLAPRDRMSVMFRYTELIGQHLEEFALLDTLDMGKPINEMLTIDGPASRMTFQFFAESIDKIEGVVTQTASDAFHYILHEPIGVVGCIVPWNYPLMMAAWKIAPALAAGNSVVLKPAEQSPMSAALLAKLFMEAGGPAGVLNIVNGFGEEVGKALALHMDVDKIAFTGSVEVGKLMMIYAGQSNMKMVSNECGGKTPQIIMADVPDLDIAVTYAVNGIYGNQGEVCNAGSRLLVDAKIHDEFVAKFIDRSKTAFIPGDPLDVSTTMGPLVTAEQQKRVLGYIDAGKKEGAVLVVGGGVPSSLKKGFYVEPTMFRGVKPGMKIAQEEIFGPVASVLSFKTTDEALEIANGTIYGLAASIWTRDVTTAHKMARAVEAGVVWINCFDHGDMTQPWGGYKQTGSGRDKCFETLLAHTQTKSVWVNLPA